jgi:hypothetical protein
LLESGTSCQRAGLGDIPRKTVSRSWLESAGGALSTAGSTDAGSSDLGSPPCAASMATGAPANDGAVVVGGVGRESRAATAGSTERGATMSS